MRILACSLAVVMFCTIANRVAAEQHESEGEASAWFDMKNCAFCKHMGAHPDMMATIQWDIYKVAHGMLMVAVIPQEHRSTWETVCKQMKAVGEEAASGEKLQTCGFCQSYGQLMQAGANVQDISTDFGELTLITADDPETVAMIHECAEKSIEENEKMKAAQ